MLSIPIEACPQCLQILASGSKISSGPSKEFCDLTFALGAHDCKIWSPSSYCHWVSTANSSNAEWFQDNLPAVEVAAEGELLVESTDNKGIVMRHKPIVEKLPVGTCSTGHFTLDNGTQPSFTTGPNKSPATAVPVVHQRSS